MDRHFKPSDVDNYTSLRDIAPLRKRVNTTRRGKCLTLSFHHKTVNGLKQPHRIIFGISPDLKTELKLDDVVTADILFNDEITNGCILFGTDKPFTFRLGGKKTKNDTLVCTSPYSPQFPYFDKSVKLNIKEINYDNKMIHFSLPVVNKALKE